MTRVPEACSTPGEGGIHLHRPVDRQVVLGSCVGNTWAAADDVHVDHVLACRPLAAGAGSADPHRSRPGRQQADPAAQHGEDLDTGTSTPWSSRIRAAGRTGADLVLVRSRRAETAQSVVRESGNQIA